MPSYQMELQIFLNELKRWKLTKDSLYRVKVEDFKTYLVFSFCLPNTQEEYVSSIKKKNLTKSQIMDLRDIVIPAKRISENMKAAKIITNKLMEVQSASQSKQYNR